VGAALAALIYKVAPRPRSLERFFDLLSTSLSNFIIVQHSPIQRISNRTIIKDPAPRNPQAVKLANSTTFGLKSYDPIHRSRLSLNITAQPTIHGQSATYRSQNGGIGKEGI